MESAPPRLASDAATRDADVVALLHSGDVATAFELLIARYETKVYHLCLVLLREAGAAQDAAQDSLLRVWRALGSFDASKASISTWVYAVTRNRCLSLLAAARQGEVESMSVPEVQAEVDALIAPVAAQSGDDGIHVLHRLVEALPDTQRRCITLFYFEERSVTEAASMLGLPEGTVKTHLHRARAALLRALQALGLAETQLWLN